MNLLVCTDGHPYSDRAVDFAIDLAKNHNGTLAILFVVQPDSSEGKDKAIKKANMTLSKSRTKAKEHGVDPTLLLEGGEPMETILLAAEMVDADVIVLGNSGSHAGLSKLLNPSVSAAITKEAKCTVIIAR